MYKFVIYISIFLVSLMSKMYGQTNDSLPKKTQENGYVINFTYGEVNEEDVFQIKVNKISKELDKAIKSNKEALKKDLLLIEQQLKNKEISVERAEVLKNEKAVFYANKIDEATLKSENEINQAIQAKVNNEMNMKASLNDYIKSLVEKRSKFILSFGFGTSLMLVDGSLNTDIYKTKPFSSINFGLGGKTRLMKDNPHYYLRYEWTTIINFAKPANQKVLDIVDNKTTLVDYEKPLKKSRIDFTQSRISAYFEYDFSKKKEDEYGNVILRSRQSYFVGIGGFVGYGNKNVTQIMKYKTPGKEHKNREVGAYGVTQFVYGVGAYVGHKNVSLFATYNLNPTFKNSEFEQHFLNIGLNLDIF